MPGMITIEKAPAAGAGDDDATGNKPARRPSVRDLMYTGEVVASISGGSEAPPKPSPDSGGQSTAPDEPKKKKKKKKEVCQLHFNRFF